LEVLKALLQVLMQFGLGQQLTGGKFDWSHIHRQMTGSCLVFIGV